MLGLCDCIHPSFASLDWLGPPPVGRLPHYSVPLCNWKGAGGVCPPRIHRHTPSLKTENFDEKSQDKKNKVMTRKVLSLLSGLLHLRPSDLQA